MPPELETPETPTEPTEPTETSTESQVETPPSAEDSDPPEDDFDYGAFVDDEPEGDDPPVDPPAETPPAEPAAPEPPAPAADAAPPPEPQPTAGEPGSQEPAAPAPTQEPTDPQPPAQPTDLNAQYQEWFNSSVDQLSQQVYQLDEETREQLDTQPSQVIPKLAARLHMQVLTAAATQLANLIPQMVPQVLESRTREEETERQFYEQWPQLKDHRQDVNRLAAAYLQSNPKAPVDRAMKEIGAMAMVALQIPLEAQSPPPAAQTPPPVTPTSARGAPAAQSTPTKKTEWDELIEAED